MGFNDVPSQQAEEAKPLQQIDLGKCPWCGKAREIEVNGIKATHPPESCCIEAVVWQLAWRYKDREYSSTVPAMMQVLRGKLDAEGLTGPRRKERVLAALTKIKQTHPHSGNIIEAIGGVLKRQHEAGR